MSCRFCAISAIEAASLSTFSGARSAWPRSLIPRIYASELMVTLLKTLSTNLMLLALKLDGTHDVYLNR